MRVTGPAQPAELLLDILDLLNELGIPYGIVGALAVSYYGVPRATADADTVIWLNDIATDAQNLQNRLVAAGYRAELKRGDADDPILRAIPVEDEYENRMDILMGIRGMDPAAMHRCVSASLLDSSVRIISAEDLIAMKIFAGGLQDLEDVRGILHVSDKRLNLDLLQTAAGRYGSATARMLDELLDE